MVSDRIKILREKRGWTQADLAKILNVTRSSVNAWEQGISVPSTALIVMLAGVLNVSTDYLLGADQHAVISVCGLSDEEVAVLVSVANQFRKNKDIQSL